MNTIRVEKTVMLAEIVTLQLIKRKKFKRKMYHYKTPKVIQKEKRSNKRHKCGSENGINIIHDLHKLCHLTNNNVFGHHSSVLKTTSIQDINSLFICLKAKHSDGRSSCTIDASLNEYVVDTLGDTGAEFCYIAENLCKFLHLEIELYDCHVLVGNIQKLLSST